MECLGGVMMQPYLDQAHAILLIVFFVWICAQLAGMFRSSSRINILGFAIALDSAHLIFQTHLNSKMLIRELGKIFEFKLVSQENALKCLLSKYAEGLPRVT